MSPEQFDGGIVDARSDQFSFCVALYEALYSARPFPGKDVAELKVGLRGPAIEPSAAQRKGSPRWLHQVVARGLAHDPARRFASMDQLVTALGFDQRRRRRNTVVTVVAGAAVIGLAAAWIAGGASEEPGCTTAAAEIGATWNDPERAAVRAALAKSTLPFAADAAAGVVAALDRYAERWQASHTSVCEATRVKHTQSTAAMDLRMSCLARRKRELESLVDLLATASPELTEHARDAVAGLPSLAACDDVAALSGVVPMPADPVVRGEIDGVRANLVRADVWLDSGMLAQAKPMIEAQVTTAGRIGYPPLEAEALIVRGRMEIAQGSFAPAAATYQAAAASADRGRDDRTRFRAWAGEVTALGSAGTLDAAEARLPAAEASLERAGSDDELAELWAETRARLHYLRGRIDEAAALYQDAIAHARARGDQHALGALLDAQVVTTLYSSDPAKVLPLAEESLALSIEEYGPLHPEPARREASVGRVLDLQGKLDDALARLAHARESLAAVYGADHAEVARIGLTIGAVYRTMGRNDDARTELLHSLKVVRAAYGDNHFIVADALTDLALIERRDGNFDTGLAYAREAQHILESTLGPTTDGLVATHHTIGLMLREKGELAEAEKSFLAGLAIGEKIAPDNPRLALFHGMIGSIRLERNDAAGAEQHLLRAIEIYSKGAADPVHLAYMRLDLAYAKEALGKWSEVLELVTLAHAAMRAPEDIAEAEKMLAKVKKRVAAARP
jgi:tetratricopeptide (TPR) repeat protein